MGISRVLIILGLVLVAAGVMWPFLSRLGLGRLPGDIAIQGESYSFYFPIVTCIILSIAGSLLLWLVNR
ncbi:MAG TPA: DUF2905 domain-containing protein [Xanthobacteraceae bacterium]|nr:DUF2905 domain-containing protein [Xanthobacteraceae bacterium]